MSRAWKLLANVCFGSFLEIGERFSSAQNRTVVRTLNLILLCQAFRDSMHPQYSSEEILMDWLTFISAMTSAIAWPLVVFFIAFILREKILALIPSLREVTMPGGFAAKFESKLESIEINNPDAPTLANTVDGPANDVLTLAPISEVDPLALQYHPTGVVMESWKEVESAARTLLKLKVENADENIPASKVFTELDKNDLLTSKDREILEELRVLRNMVAHTPDVWIAPSQAERFKLLSTRLVQRLRIRKNIEKLDVSQ
jgi:hypothetical protein